MSSTLNKTLARELATKINKVVNIPLMNEKEEQILFELIILVILDIFLSGVDATMNLE
ncbi:MAG: hypothetical protein PHC50_05555 [Candidatus Cloacimonetes bacterium]|nr:hypothetical protein [Candidatus Cloacimonadota bacterium]